jgi:hypothetical protein
MKTFYLTGAIIFTVLVLVLAFENISAQCSNMFFFFFPIRSNPTVVSLAIAALGVITGIFYHGFFTKFFAESSDEESDEF